MSYLMPDECVYSAYVKSFSFSSRRLSRLSCINDYLAIDSGGHVSE